MEMAITTYHASAITLDPQRGTFQAIMDGDIITDPTLQGIYDRIAAIEDRQKDAARKAQRPVEAVLLFEPRYGRPTIQACTVLGMHAGRTNEKTLRVRIEDKKTSLNIGYTDPLVVLHPDDPRVATIKAHLQAIGVAKINLAAAEESFKNYKATLPTVRVPVVASKEEAVSLEPVFLAEMQATITQTSL